MGRHPPANNNASIDLIMEGQETNTWNRIFKQNEAKRYFEFSLICHVNEPLNPEGVEGGHKVQGDPGGHEERHGNPVDGVGSARPILVVIPLTPVKQARVLVGQQELLLKYDDSFIEDSSLQFTIYLVNVNHINMNEKLDENLYKPLGLFAKFGISRENSSKPVTI